MNLLLNDKCVPITGATRGIGQSIATRVLHEGARVAFCARTIEDISHAESTLNANEGNSRIRGWQVDLSKPVDIENWMTLAIEFLGGIDIVICNASGMGISDRDSDWRMNYAVEITALRRILDRAKPKLRESADKHGSAAIIAIASTSASKPTRVEAYGPMKAALVHYMKAISKELGAFNIRASTVSPGPTYVADGFWGQVEQRDPALFERTSH